MIVYDCDQKDFYAPREHLSIALGNFDGFHKGHQELLLNTMKTNFKSAVLLFKSHSSILLLDGPERFLMSLEDKLAFLEKFSIDRVFMKSFDPEFMQMDKDVFIEDFLMKKLSVKDIVVGRDFRFAKNGQGTIQDLFLASQKFDLSVNVVDDILYQDKRISSTRIRNTVENGGVEEASSMLGYPYTIRGKVVTGEGRGGKLLGFPTANLELSFPYCLPKDGVYLTRVLLGQSSELFGLTNIGSNPTFTDSKMKKIETYILDFNQGIYGRDLALEFLRFEREDIKFDSVEELVSQMRADEKLLRSWIPDFSI